MERFVGLRGTVAASLITLCCSTVCCAAGIYAVTDPGRSLQLGPTAGVPMIVLGVVVWTLPPLLWSRLTPDGREDTDNE